MRRHTWSLLVLLLPFAVPAGAQTSSPWHEGQNYFLIDPAQPTNVPAGKVEVTEVFSYACPACNEFYPVWDRIRESLPANAQVDYVSAAFNPEEDWPVFQRAYYAAKALGIAEKTHDAMFNAVWKSGELAVADQQTGRLKSPAPDIQDIANFYHRATGISTQEFLAAANSFSVNLNMRRADSYIMSALVDETPTIIINGKYRLTVPSAGGYNQTIELVKYLVAKESK